MKLDTYHSGTRSFCPAVRFDGIRLLALFRECTLCSAVRPRADRDIIGRGGLSGEPVSSEAVAVKSSPPAVWSHDLVGAAQGPITQPICIGNARRRKSVYFPDQETANFGPAALWHAPLKLLPCLLERERHRHVRFGIERMTPQLLATQHDTHHCNRGNPRIRLSARPSITEGQLSTHPCTGAYSCGIGACS